MNLFEKWSKDPDNKECISLFLSKDPESVALFENNNEATQNLLVSTLLKVKPEKIIDVILSQNIHFDLKPSDIPQFSSFNCGTQKICEVLEFFPNGLNFEDLGYQLRKSSKPGARVKYGENHAKLATVFQIVKIVSLARYTVFLTPFGKKILRLADNKDQRIFQNLLFREKIIRKIISSSKDRRIIYRDITKNIATSTAIRRRSNVKYLLSLALSGTTYDYINEIVIW